MAGQSYIVRYRYHLNFRAYQNGQRLNVEPVRPVMELPLTFMRVKAIEDGQIILWFADFISRIFGDEGRKINASMQPGEVNVHTLNQQGEEIDLPKMKRDLYCEVYLFEYLVHTTS